MTRYIRPLVRLAVRLVATLLATGALVPAAAGERALPPLGVPAGLKVVSYYRTDAGWEKFWTDWQPERVASDLTRVALLHANTVRAIVQPDAFGYPRPGRTYLNRLRRFVSLAHQHGLRVQLTLFDRWFEWGDLRGSRTWARALLRPYAGDSRIAFVELRNELLPQPQTLAWARALVPFVQHVLRGKTPVTVSVTGAHPVQRLASLKRGLRRTPPDFFDLHYFGGGGELAYSTFRKAKRVAAPTPVWVGETGYPTTSEISGYGGVPKTIPAQEAAQAHFLASVAWAARANRLAPPGIWALDDFSAAAFPDPPSDALDPELHFGVFRTDGSVKPAADAVRAAFSGGSLLGFNGGFETAVSDERGNAVPAQWSMQGPAAFAVDAAAAHTGASSVRLTSASISETSSLSITPPGAGFAGHGHVSVGAWARSAQTSGRVFLVVEWYDRTDRLLTRTASAPLASTSWARLSLDTDVPAGAAYLRIDLVAQNVAAPVWFDDVSFDRQAIHT